MTGIIADTIAVLLGGIIGSELGKFLPKDLTHSVIKILGFCAITIGIVSVVNLDNLSFVIFSIIGGYILGWASKIEDRTKALIKNIFTKNDTVHINDESRTQLFCTGLMIVCFSGTGIYGALMEGIANDHTILLAKAMLDFFTIIVIATKLGKATSMLAVPQILFLSICYIVARVLLNSIPLAMVNDFKAVGGIITIMVGYNMIVSEREKIKVLNLLPSLFIILFVSSVFGVISG